MARKPTAKRIIAEKYCDKFPELAHYTLAKLMYNENKHIYNDTEDARTHVRVIRGKQGKRAKKYLKDKTHVENFKRSSNPYSIPPSELKEYKPFYLPKDRKKILFLSDIHIPYHNIDAITLALDYGKERNIDTIWLNGDIMDMYKASDHLKDPTQKDLLYEFDVTMQFLKVLKKTFPNAQIYYKQGNHETRWERYLMRNAPVLFGFKEFELPFILKLNELGIHWIPNNQLAYFGKLAVIHGNEMRGGGGVMVSRTLYLKAGESVIAGDKHKTNEYTKMTLGGSMVGTWSVGCLCELNPDYLPMGNDWNLGFAMIEIKSNGEYIVDNKRVHKNQIY